MLYKISRSFKIIIFGLVYVFAYNFIEISHLHKVKVIRRDRHYYNGHMDFNGKYF